MNRHSPGEVTRSAREPVRDVQSLGPCLLEPHGPSPRTMTVTKIKYSGENDVLVRCWWQQGLASRTLCVVAGPWVVLVSHRCFEPFPNGNEVWCLFLCPVATGTSSFVRCLSSIFLLGHLSLVCRIFVWFVFNKS